MGDGTNAAVGIRELKANLSEYVNRAVYRGEVIEITKNGKRVAAIVPIEVVDAAEAHEVLARLQQRPPGGHVPLDDAPPAGP